jgi:hypothetical protein
MAQTTYGKLAELIITEYYKKYRSDNANYTLRQIAEQIAQEVAYFAKADAFEQDKLGEAMFANDQFITTYFGLPLQTDVNDDNYISLPATPAGMPQGREIAYVGFTGNKKVQVFPMRNKDVFVQNFTQTPKWMILCYVENGNLVFNNMPKGFVSANVDVKLVGAVPAGELVNQVLNVPKSTETMIMDKLLARMNSMRNITPDNVNDNVSK